MTYEEKQNAQDVKPKLSSRIKKTLKSAGQKVKSGAKWCYDKRHWFGAGAVAAFAIYAKGHFDGEHLARKLDGERTDKELEFMRALTGDVTGLSEEKIQQAAQIREFVEDMEIDPYKLQDIYEQWSQDDWDEFIENKYDSI